MPPIILMPGMDGTGILFQPLERELRARGATEVRITRYPTDEVFDVEAYLAHVPLAQTDAVHLVAESFSGPLAIQLAAREGIRVRSMTLIASFARSPRPRLLSAARSMGHGIFAAPPPSWAVRTFMAGGAEAALMGEIRRAINLPSPRAMASRLRWLSNVDVRDELRSIACPFRAVLATRDRLVPTASHHELVSLGASAADVDAPHLAAQVAPGRCAEIILEDATRGGI